MKKLVIAALFVFMLGLIVTSCTTTPNSGKAETLEEAYPDRFEKTKIGMSLDEFKQIWPEATKAGLSSDSETYEFIYTHLLEISFIYDCRIRAAFHFVDNKLTKYESNKEAAK